MVNRRILGALWVVSFAMGCAGARHVQNPKVGPSDRAMHLDGVVIQTAPDRFTHLETYDAEQLFEAARELTRQERLRDAMEAYERLLEYFPNSGFVEPALFNLALLHEREKSFERASQFYLRIAEPEPPQSSERRRTWLDAHLRLAVTWGAMKDWWRVVAVFDRLLELSWLEDTDRLEALLGRGIALQEAGDPQGAEVAFAKVLRFAREATKRAPLLDKGMVAEAAFRMGDIAAERYAAVELAFPVELLRQRLEEKCRELLNAQHRYVRAIRHGDAHTVAAAGYRIGHLYESLYDGILALEIPPELTADQGNVYQEEVRQRVSILLEKAIRIYEQALRVGRNADTAVDWVERLETAVERLRELYLKTPEVAFESPGVRPRHDGPLGDVLERPCATCIA